MSKPLLSIAIIFKNDIRCIERCLKALQPLRDAVSSELVMADTGSTDGSRKVVEWYADILFDFPWVDDFSAARNAVIDRCSGEWIFTVDTDEYLDEAFQELLNLLHAGQEVRAGAVTIRSYDSYEMDGAYADFLATRLVRRSMGARYQGAIHEHMSYPAQTLIHALPEVILHHDGYVGLGDERGSEKRARNMALLRKELEKDPNGLKILMQFIESGPVEADYMEKIFHAVSLIDQKWPDWDQFGPSILRHAVIAAHKEELPVLNDWVRKAEELFPNSAFTQIDVNYVAFSKCLSDKNYAGAVVRGERYLQALADSRAQRLDPTARCYSIIEYEAPSIEQEVRFCLASAYLRENRIERALNILESLDYSVMDGNNAVRAIQVLRELYSGSTVDTTKAVAVMWEGVCAPGPSEKKAAERKRIVLYACRPMFGRKFLERELTEQDFCRHSYSMLLPLQGQCELGRAAALLQAGTPSERETVLVSVEDWEQFPIEALGEAVMRGVPFPPAGRPMTLETLDGLAERLIQGADDDLLVLHGAAEHCSEADSVQRWAWVRGLAMAAVRRFDWGTEEPPAAAGLELARLFARIESVFLPRCYAAEMLREENIPLVPPLHRFGWYCARALEALDAGSTVDYVRLLRSGLEACREGKPMVEFLQKHTPELNVPEPSEELRVLAEQVRLVLSRFAPDDPMVAALKQSEVYQKVAELMGEEL